jgi:group I intron endonuclease
MGSIYKIINVVNGKLYIGSTMHKFSKRKSEHLTALRKGYHFNSHLQSAWNKYGEENFIFEILERFSDDVDQIKILQKELELINLITPEYNICKKTAGGKLGRILTDSEKKKIGDFHRGKKHSEETIFKIKEARKIQIITEDHKRKISESLIGKSGRNIGRKQTKEQKEKASEFLKNQRVTNSGIYSPESLAKRTLNMIERNRTLEMREKISKLAKARFSKKFLCYKIDGEFIGEFVNQIEASKKLGFQKPWGISAVLNGLQSTHKGYTFKYAE